MISAILEHVAPGAMLDTSGDVVGAGVGLCGLKVHVTGSSWRVEGVEGVHACDLSSVSGHATSSLAGLDVSPDHWSHVALVIHEAGIEVGCVVRVVRDDVGRPSRERVLQEMEHRKELARWHTAKDSQSSKCIASVTHMLDV